MSHLKRNAVPKTWPVKRKGTAFVVKPNLGLSNSLPLLIILRDLIKVANNRKEVKKMINMKNILLNGKTAKDEKEGVLLFDVITLVPSKKNYRLTILKNGKLNLKEIKENESIIKVAKIINKRRLKGKKTQLNLSDGRNFISDIKCEVNDSVIINLKDKKVESVIHLEEGSKVIVFAGKHSGEEGNIEQINKENKVVRINLGNEKINVLIKQIMVIN